MALGTTAILVDTHFVLWVRVAPKALTRGERTVLDHAAVRHVSIVSLWEIAILLRLGRIPGDDSLVEIPEGFILLPVGLDHCKTLAALPMHHRDPFDRMLIAQARSEGVPLLTRDRAIAAYREDATILRYPDA